MGPPGSRRETLAGAFARLLRGSVEIGFKCFEGRRSPDGPVVYELTPSYRVRDARGTWQLTLDDDLSITHTLDLSRPTRRGQLRLLSLEPSLAWFLERRIVSPTTLEDAVKRFAAVFGLTQGRKLESTTDPDERILFDPYGNHVAARTSYPRDRERVVEIITRPLRRGERAAVLTRWLDLANDHGFSPPDDGALQFHFDRAPWRDTRRLKALVTTWNRQRERHLRRWQPRQESRWRGPFPPELLRTLARVPKTMPFRTLARRVAALPLAKTLDWNIRGVVLTRTRTPTLEARFWNSTTHPALVLESLALTEEFLRGVAQRADAARA